MLAPGRSAYWQTVTGRLLRIEVATGKVTRIALGGATFPNGDGLLVQGNLLHGVQNREERIVPVLLRERATRGVAGPGVTGPQLKFPTTIARDGDRLPAVNSQFDKQVGTPDRPFDVATIRAPKAPKAPKG